jgi:hypothetical protein
LRSHRAAVLIHISEASLVGNAASQSTLANTLITDNGRALPS